MRTHTRDNAFFSFCPELLRLLTERTAVGRSGKEFEGLHDLSTRNNLIVLRNALLEIRPASSLEVGLGFGGSALVIASTLRDMWGEVPSRHVCIDPYQTSGWDDAGLRSLERAGLTPIVELRRQPSRLALPQLEHEGRRFQFIYIDGSHLFEDTFLELCFSNVLLDIGGYIFFDDSTYPDIKKVHRFLTANWSDAYKRIDLVRWRMDQRKAWRYRLASQLRMTQLVGYQKVGNPSRQWRTVLKRF